jgi:acyl-CoA synthetase (NDP forming)
MSKMMLEPDAVGLLERYGIPYPQNEFVSDEDALIKAANKISYPVVLKVVSYDIVHKSDAGGVAVNIRDDVDCIKKYREILESTAEYNPAAEVRGVLVCKMAEPETELIVGVVKDDIFGHTVMAGLGGIFVEILKDVSYRVCPIELSEAKAMLTDLKAYNVLKGYRGKKGVDVDAVAQLIHDVSRMVCENPCIAEMDLNPVRAYGKGVMVLDARIMVEED